MEKTAGGRSAQQSAAILGRLTCGGMGTLQLCSLGCTECVKRLSSNAREMLQISEASCCQVALAQLQYQLPRLTRMWSHLERQAGGRVRGMGEKQLEVDKRLMRTRIGQLQVLQAASPSGCSQAVSRACFLSLVCALCWTRVEGGALSGPGAVRCGGSTLPRVACA